MSASAPASSASHASRAEARFLLVLFACSLLAHAWFATRNWTAGFMPGHEFRQAQTALVTDYIDRQNNFSLRYETPIFGKPWVSNVLEFPLYQWSVVGLSRALDLPHVVAARTVSLACFYLALPAFYLLLGAAGLPPARRLFVLALTLACPVYIFYSRSFLIESMELMFSAWFLAAFVNLVQTRRWPWWGLAVLAGSGAALVKNTTWAVWLLAAAALAVARLWPAWRRRDWRDAALTAAWSLAAVAPSLAVLRWWLAFTDDIKLAHASAFIFSSRHLSQDNFGLLAFGARFSAQTWQKLLAGWDEAILAPWLAVLVVLPGLVLSRHRPLLLLCGGTFLGAQFLFPFAYADQEYYFYACAVFLLAALGLGAIAVLDSRWPRSAAWPFAAVPLIALFANYHQGYRTAQIIPSPGGSQLTALLNDTLPRDAVMIVAGADWSAIVPYYAQRRALMIRTGLEYDEPYLRRALGDLADENVGVLIVFPREHRNHALIRRITTQFDLDPAPTFHALDAEVYVSQIYRENLVSRVRLPGSYPQVVLPPPPANPAPASRDFMLSPAQARRLFPQVTPAPVRAHFDQGFAPPADRANLELGTHPDSHLWVPSPATAREIVWHYGIAPGAYEKDGDKTDGVTFQIVGEVADGPPREIFRRTLDPVAQPSDRGRQETVLPYSPRPGETLVFSTLPHVTHAYDWCFWTKIDVH